jgi:hypothetical protein
MEKTIDELRAFVDQLTAALGSLVEGVMLVARDEVAELLAQFNELVPACNERLQHCAGLLAKGLRDEMLGYEADDPALLNTVDLLDLASRPQWDTWLEALQALGFPEPPMPKVEIAADIRAAQDACARLRPLLDQWRRINLSNGPLPARIGVLRSLRKEDPGNEAWFECLKAHERQRAMEIEAHVNAAAAANDEESLARISAELQTEWLEQPPARLCKAVGAALTAMRGSRIERDIEQAAAGLAAALEAKDLDAARAFRERWNPLAEQKGAFSEDDTRFISAAPVLEWIDRHDRLESLFAEVWQSLDAHPQSRNAKRGWVRSLARMRDEVEDLAEKLRDDIDLEPIERLRARVTRVEEDHRRDLMSRRRLTYLIVGGVTTLIVSAVAVSVSVLRHNDRIRQALAEIDAIVARLEGGDVAPSEVPVIDWPDWLKADPVVAARLSQLESAVEGESKRRARLEGELGSLDEMLGSLSKVPRAESIQDWPAEFVAATKLLGEINSSGVVKTADDKAAVSKREGLLQNAAKRFQRDADEFVEAGIRDLSAKTVALRGRVKASPGDVATELAKLEEDVESLRNAATELGAASAAGVFSQLTRASRGASQPLRADGAIPAAIAEIKGEVEEWRRFSKAEQGIDEAIGDWQRYASRLSAAAAEFPRQAVARDYGEAASEVELWLALEQWNRFAGDFQQTAEMSTDQARAALEAIARVRPAAARLGCDKRFLDRLEPVIKSFADREAGGVGKKLDAWIAKWLTEVGWVVTKMTQEDDSEKPGKKVLYCLDKPKEGSGRFKYLAGFRDANDIWPEKSEVFDAETDSIEPSPQKKLGDDIEMNCVAKIQNANGIALEEALSDAITRTLKAKDVDPCLRMLTLRKILSLGKEVSLVFQSKQAVQLLEMMDDGESGVPGFEFDEITTFVDPNRDDLQAYKKVRRFSEGVLQKSSKVGQQISEKAKEVRQSLATCEFPTYQCVGRLSRDTAGDVIVAKRASTVITPGEDLLVVDPSGGVRKIGTCRDDGRISLEMRSLVAGVPVFMEQRKGAKE